MKFGKKHRDDGTEKTQEEMDAEKREEETQLKLQSDNAARRAEDGFTAPSADAPKMDEQTFARQAGLPHEDFVQKQAREVEEEKHRNKENQKKLDWKDDPTQKCPACGFRYSGCHDKHSTVTLVCKVILNGVELGPGEVIVPTEASATWMLGL